MKESKPISFGKVTTITGKEVSGRISIIGDTVTVEELSPYGPKFIKFQKYEIKKIDPF
ncbi:MAG: hypothetical protein ACTSYD_13635 [Candidatus Heimdallarchaeaceae archaeon]